MTMSPSSEANRALGLSTFAFVICFAVWTIFAIIGIQIREQLSLTETQFGLLIGMPVLTGSLVRIVLGVLTDRLGGRVVSTLTMLAAALATFLLGWAQTYTQMLLAALGVGLGGFFLPLLFGWLKDTTGLWSSCFAVLFLLVAGCLIWMHVSIRRLNRAPALQTA